MNTDEAELRPLTSPERRQLKSYVRYRVGVGGLATLVVTNLATKVAVLSDYLLHIIVASMTIAAVLAFRRARKRRRKAGGFQSTIKADLASGQAEVCPFEAIEAIEGEQFEDEGIGFYLRVGQHLDDLAEEKRFPCKTFKLVRSLERQIPLDLICTGDYFPPFGILPPFNEGDSKKERIPSDGDLLAMDFESLKKLVVKHE